MSTVSSCWLAQARFLPLLYSSSPLSRVSFSISPSSLRFFSSKNPKRPMAEKRTIADVLMANARAAAARKKVTRPSPKKRKALEDNGTPTTESELKQTEEPKEPNLKKVAVAKKGEGPISVEERIGKLKKKAADFDPKSAAFWKDGEPVPFLFVARAFDMIANETGRIVITELLCNVFRTIIASTPGDLIPVIYLSANKIAPAHEGVELGIGDAALIKALAEAYGRKEEMIKKQLKELGDLGLVAKESRSSQSVMFKPPPLTVAKVFDTFRVIAKESGKDSQDKKRKHIKGLLVAATDCEPLYLVRLLQSKLRIGLAEQTLLVALGQAAVYSGKHSNPSSQIQSPLEEAAKIVKQVYSVLPIYDKIVPALLSGGVWKLQETCNFTLGVPVGPMLAKPTKGVSEILDKFQDTEFTCEYKYDGERAQVIVNFQFITTFPSYLFHVLYAICHSIQIHYMEDGSVEIYSRNAERNTGKFPDVVHSVKRYVFYW
uniref:DNA ligase 1-like n=1 Tax=Nelumbo nucifera TaxID=4432 RepID=A0A822ZWF9_NELNU|nr:TPA_asm: hypothetical protein HUJ06_018747 [Nelumbo nucifera]